MKHLLIIQIHGSFASVSSSDQWLSRELTAAEVKRSLFIKGSPTFETEYARLSRDHQRSFEDASSLLRLDGESYFVTQASLYDGWTAYYTEDVEFYWAGLHQRGLPSFDIKDKVRAYKEKGFSAKEPADYLAVKKAHDDAEEKANTANRIREGYVFPTTTMLPREQMQGGLSDELFNHPELISYMKPGKDGAVCCFGYVGNSNRRVKLDRFLESHMRETLGWSLHDIAVWLGSREGRHMADSYESPDDCLKHSFTNWAVVESRG